MRKTVRMPRHHAGPDIIAAEELAGMIEDHFVIIVVGVEERNLQRAGMAFDRPRYESADDETIGDEGRVH